MSTKNLLLSSTGEWVPEHDVDPAHVLAGLRSALHALDRGLGDLADARYGPGGDFETTPTLDAVVALVAATGEVRRQVEALDVHVHATDSVTVDKFIAEVSS